MCGIAGFSIADEDRMRFDSRRLAAELLLEIVARGRHATGAAWTQQGKEGRELWYAKRQGPAHLFLPSLANVPRYSRTMILHTRYATQGDPAVEHNNHPIVVPGVVGVHNGHIGNDDEIIAEYGGERTGQVDSEAAFRLIANSTNVIADLPRLQGRAALAWMETDTAATLRLARLTGSPLAIGQTPGGSTIFASTEGHLRIACRAAGIPLEMSTSVDELTYIEINTGRIDEWQALAPAPAAQGRLF